MAFRLFSTVAVAHVLNSHGVHVEMDARLPARGESGSSVGDAKGFSQNYTHVQGRQRTGQGFLSKLCSCISKPFHTDRRDFTVRENTKLKQFEIPKVFKCCKNKPQCL